MYKRQDLDTGDTEQQEIRDQYQAESNEHDAYLVVIGRKPEAVLEALEQAR